MTANEKWKESILEAISKKNLTEWIMQYMELPRIVLSSIEKSEIVEEIFICPHCFNKTTQQYPEDEYKSTEAVCSHCGAKFVSENKTSTMKGTVNWTPSNRHSIHGIFITTDTIEGQKGALYIEAEYVQFVCDAEKKKLSFEVEIVGFGFAFDGDRYRYMNGKASRAKTVNYNSYYWPNYFADDSFLEYCKEIECPSSKLKSCEVSRLMYELEEKGDKIPDPERSISARQAARFMEQYPIEELSGEFFDRYEYINVKTVKSDIVNNMRYYRCHCKSCDNRFAKRIRAGGYQYERAFVCPKCNKGTMSFIDGRKIFKKILVFDVSGNDILVVRAFDCWYSCERGKVSVKPREKERIYINFGPEAEWKRNVILYDLETKQWKYKKNGEIENYKIEEDNYIFAPEALEILKYTGFGEYLKNRIESEKRSYNSYHLISAINFLESATMNSCLEKFSKIGWFNYCTALVDVIRQENYVRINPQSSTIHGILQIPKRLIKFIGEQYGNNPDEKQVNAVHDFYKIDENVLPEDINWCREHQVSPSDVKKVVDKLNISVHQVCEYLERVRISQCFIPKSAIIEWIDYLNAAEKIEADLKDKTVRYPSSLKREHDRAMFKYKIIKDAEKEKFFKENCDEYGSKYAFEDENFSIITPKDMQDLFEEGRKLNHCVGSYADRIIEGKTCICFVRRKAQPEQPYFTIEVSPYEERVRQIHGLSNRLVDRTKENNLYKFLRLWAKKKSLDISIM